MTFQDSIIFIVDDDPSILRALRRLFKSEGIAVETFNSAETFLASDALSHPKACLVLDVQMPKIDGLALQRMLNERGATVPVVFITAQEDESIRVNAIDAGASAFLQKPIDDVKLLGAVENALATV